MFPVKRMLQWESMEHGTYSKYIHDKCRCEACKKANSLRAHQWRSWNKDRAQEYQRAYVRRRDRKARIDALEAYGRVCACCNEDRIDFLCIDHVEGGGNLHKQALSSSLYQFLIKAKFPSGYQVLCWNCNYAKHRYGACPYHRAASDWNAPKFDIFIEELEYTEIQLNDGKCDEWYSPNVDVEVAGRCRNCTNDATTVDEMFCSTECDLVWHKARDNHGRYANLPTDLLQTMYVHSVIADLLLRGCKVYRSADNSDTLLVACRRNTEVGRKILVRPLSRTPTDAEIKTVVIDMEDLDCGFVAFVDRQCFEYVTYCPSNFYDEWLR